MSLYAAYEALLIEELGGRLTKSRAISLSGRPPSGFDKTSVRRLYDSLDLDCWRSPAQPKASNWLWRTKPPDDRLGSPEVGLERAIAKLDGLTSWSFQMSTCSGIRGTHADKRRAIDLVRDYGQGHFAFVELKVGSNDPLYAAFEILRYYLAYLHARSNGLVGAASRGLDSAKRIDLVVLGPDSWYCFRNPGGGQQRFDFGWLTAAISEGVGLLPSPRPEARLEFMEFQGAANQRAQAAEIVELFKAPKR